MLAGNIASSKLANPTLFLQMNLQRKVQVQLGGTLEFLAGEGMNTTVANR